MEYVFGLIVMIISICLFASYIDQLRDTKKEEEERRNGTFKMISDEED